MRLRLLASVGFRPSICAAGLLAAAGALSAQTSVSTDPVGAFVLSMNGSSDTLLSLPLHRPVSLEATVSGVSGNVVTLSLSGSNLTASEFVYQGSGTNTYYMQFLSGNREGMYYTVTANDAASNISVDLAGDAGFSGNVNVGDSLQIIPYWTLNTLFPAGAGINPSPSFSLGSRNTDVLFPNLVSAGTNLSPTADYYYYNGTASGGAGWRKVGSPVTTKADDTILYPDVYFTVRNNVANNTSQTLVGGVPMSAYTTPLSTLSPSTDQDIPVAVDVPIAVTLAGSGLVQSGAFAPSTSFSLGTRQDLLLVFSNAGNTTNRSPASSYYYYSGASSGGPGWRLVGGSVTSIQDTSAVFQPGQAYIIRKKGTVSPSTVYWSFVPSYLTQ